MGKGGGYEYYARTPVVGGGGGGGGVSVSPTRYATAVEFDMCLSVLFSSFTLLVEGLFGPLSEP